MSGRGGRVELATEVLWVAIEENFEAEICLILIEE